MREVWCSPHENRWNHSTISQISSLLSNDWRPIGPQSPQQPFNMFHGVVGNMANMDERTCDAGWPGELQSRAPELQSAAEGALLQLNHLIRSWWLHLAGISPPHTSREAASDMVINCRVNTSSSEVSGLHHAAWMATQFTVTTNQETVEPPTPHTK